MALARGQVTQKTDTARLDTRTLMPDQSARVSHVHFKEWLNEVPGGQ